MKMEKFKVNFGKQSAEKAAEKEGEELLKELPQEEIEKTSEVMTAIKNVADVVSNTLSQLGIDNDFSMNSELVLIAKDGAVETVGVSEEEKEYIKLSKGEAFHKIIGGYVVLSEGLLDDDRLLVHALLHEFFHAASQNYAFYTKESKDIPSRLIGKSGYASYYESQDNDYLLFYGLNEAITEELARESVRMNCDELFPGKDKNEIIKSWEESYFQERQILYSIIMELSDGDDENIQKTWKKFVEGFISGSMIHLREIERHFGKGSLKILAMMTPAAGRKDIFEKNSTIVDYFSESDISTREQMKKTLLKNN